MTREECFVGALVHRRGFAEPIPGVVREVRKHDAVVFEGLMYHGESCVCAPFCVLALRADVEQPARAVET
jgi:hypothetical protein